MRGIDYYPEQWDETLIDEDLDRIKNLGADTIRIGEFSWHIIEPAEGEFDFSFWDRIIKKSKKRGLKILFGTPTATFPRWLSIKHPEIHSVGEDLNYRHFGGRRLYCYNSDIYLEYTKKIVSKLVEHYKNEESVIGWQIDNEIGHEGSDLCYCKSCKEAFSKYLRKKYKNISELNSTYGNDFWSQKYDAFEDVVIPLPTITFHNPSLSLDWYRFRSESILNYAKAQIDIVNKFKGKHQLITHNLYGGYFSVSMDQAKFSKMLDFVSFDNYPVWGGMHMPLSPSEISFSLNYIRNLKSKSFCIAEQIVGSQGHEIIGYSPSIEETSIWAKQAVLHGADSLFFFRYRGNTKAQEQLCQGIYDADNEENPKTQMVRNFFRWFKEFEDGKKILDDKEVAIVYDYDNRKSWKHQIQYEGFNYNRILNNFYSCFFNLGVGADIIDSSADFSKYKVVILPIFQIINNDITNRIRNFVKEGGTLVATYRTAVKDKFNNFVFGKKTPIELTDVFGIKSGEFVTLGDGRFLDVTKEKKKVGYCSKCLEKITLGTATELFEYNKDSEYSPICTENNFGKGKSFYIAGEINQELLENLLYTVLSKSGILALKSELLGKNKISKSLSKKNIKTTIDLKKIEIIKYKDGNFILNHSNNEIELSEKKIKPYDVVFIENRR